MHFLLVQRKYFSGQKRVTKRVDLEKEGGLTAIVGVFVGAGKWVILVALI
jgi:hypothetical protein